MKNIAFVSLLLVVTGFNAPVRAETNHSLNKDSSHSHGPANSAKMDTRIAVTLPAKAKQQILSDMRMHLEVVQGIITALAKEDLNQVADLAYKLGHMDHSEEVMKRRQLMPQGYRALGPQMHLGFQAIARDARDFGDIGQTLEQLSAAMKACTTCHQTYRIEEMPAQVSTHTSID